MERNDSVLSVYDDDDTVMINTRFRFELISVNTFLRSVLSILRRLRVRIPTNRLSELFGGLRDARRF